MFSKVADLFLIIMFVSDIISLINLIRYLTLDKVKYLIDRNKSLDKINTCQTLSFSIAFFLLLIMLKHNPYSLFIRSYIIAHIVSIFIYVIYVFLFEILIPEVRYNKEKNNNEGSLKRLTPTTKERLERIKKGLKKSDNESEEEEKNV